MDPDQAKSPSAVTEESELERAVDLIGAGDMSGLTAFYRILAPGTRLLIGQRRRHPVPEKEVKAVLETVAQRIQSDTALRGRAVLTLVRQLIVERFGNERPRTASSASRARCATRRTQAAEKIVEQLSPWEREALRRCYVLGEMPEAIVERLQLSPEQFRRLRSKARAEFSSKVPQNTNVA